MSTAVDTNRRIEVELEIAAPVDAVWAALTDPRELMRWFPLQARVAPGEGGSIWTAWGGDEWEERITVWQPNRRLTTVRARAPWSDALHAKLAEASADQRPPAMTHLTTDYYLEGRGGTTVLRLVHAGFGEGAAWDEEFDGTRRGWGYELRSLKHYLERHHGEDRAVAWVMLRTDVVPDEAWARLFGPGGLSVTPEPGSLREGEVYAMARLTAGSLHGVVVRVEPPTDFAVTVANWNDALLRVKVDEYAGEGELSFWLAGYGLPRAQLVSFEDAAEHLARELFPGARLLPHVSARAS